MPAITIKHDVSDESPHHVGYQDAAVAVELGQLGLDGLPRDHAWSPKTAASECGEGIDGRPAVR